jgi:hypothetical protein
MMITTKGTKITKNEIGFDYLRVRRALRGSGTIRVLDLEIER